MESQGTSVIVTPLRYTTRWGSNSTGLPGVFERIPARQQFLNRNWVGIAPYEGAVRARARSFNVPRQSGPCNRPRSFALGTVGIGTILSIMAELKDRPVLDAAYTWSFYGTQSPTLINYVARLNGVNIKPPSGSFTYCDLGCGNGLTANVLAASFPQGQFHAIDLNPEHIANGKRIARKSGLSNISFLENTFEELVQADLPRFDYISLHGVYSWVSAEVRQDILTVIEKTLKPGGLVYVSYNTMPGWAALLPLRQILLSYTAHMGEGSLEKAARGLEYLKFLRDNKAVYFQKNPGASEALDEILKKDLRYIVHEYLNESWHPLYFSQVASEMAQKGLSYCGSAEVRRNYRNVVVPQRFRGLLDTADNAVIRETHQSLIFNESFRCDLYCKAARWLPSAERIGLFADTVFGSNTLKHNIKRTFQVGDVKVTNADRIYDDLIPVVADGTRTVAEVCRLPTMQAYPEEMVTRSIHTLVAGGQFQPFATSAEGVEGGPPERVRIRDGFNRAVLEERLLEDAQCFLATRVLGTGIRVGLIPGLLLLACDAVGPEESADYACNLLERSGRIWRRDGEAVTNPAKRREVIKAEQAVFREHLVPALLRFGIVEPVAG